MAAVEALTGTAQPAVAATVAAVGARRVGAEEEGGEAEAGLWEAGLMALDVAALAPAPGVQKVPTEVVAVAEKGSAVAGGGRLTKEALAAKWGAGTSRVAEGARVWATAEWLSAAARAEVVMAMVVMVAWVADWRAAAAQASRAEAAAAPGVAAG